MKLLRLFIILAVAFWGTLATSQAQSNAAKKPTLAVSKIKATESLSANDKTASKRNELGRLTSSLDAQLIEAINGTHKFQLLGRNDDDTSVIFEEQNFADSGNVDPKTAAEFGKLTGAKYLLTVTVDDFQDRTRVVKLDAVRQLSIRELRVSIVAKIYDSTTGALLEAVDMEASDKMERNLNSAILADEGANTDQILVKISKSLAKQVALSLTEKLYPAKIVAVSGSYITINRGKETGIKKGQTWTVFISGEEEMIDPDTGESLGAEEMPLCDAKVMAVNEKTSSLKLLEDDPGVEKGMIVRMSESQKNVRKEK